MSKMIQIRNVPDDVHRTLKVRAAERGMSLSDYLLQMAAREAGRPTLEELAARIRRRGRVATKTRAADLIRADRGSLP